MVVLILAPKTSWPSKLKVNGVLPAAESPKILVGPEGILALLANSSSSTLCHSDVVSGTRYEVYFEVVSSTSRGEMGISSVVVGMAVV